MIYGSGLRSGFANTDHLPSYTQVNMGISHDFYIVAPNKTTTLRFNVFDKIYEIRDGSGIGVFAPQFGPRRAFSFRRKYEGRRNEYHETGLPHRRANVGLGKLSRNLRDIYP
ncbi:MAG TPA: hypothetical protein VMJ52_09165 [Xanthobacteraceae bacterium]|nr:hypothetical protein [Xanthobacteraceae bacterium]